MGKRDFLVVVLKSRQFVPFVSFLCGLIILNFGEYLTTGRTIVDILQTRNDGNDLRCSGV